MQNLKNRLGNKSAFLWTTLEDIANKLIDIQSIHPVLKLSPISADDPWGEI